MKIILTILIFFTISIYSRAQVGAMVVEDPLNASINTSIEALNQSSNALSKFLADTKMLEMAQSGLQQIKSVEEIARLIDDLACLTSDFSFYMNIQEDYSCARFLNFRLINMNLNYTTELLTSVILSKNVFTMTSGERLSNLNRVKDILQTTINEIQTINAAIRSNIVQKAYNSYVKKAYMNAKIENTIAFSRYKNR